MRLFFLADFCQYDKLLGTTRQLFNPYAETADILVPWLHYRYTYPKTTWDRQYLADLASQDMRDHGNTPVFMDFTDFDPDKASRNFLAAWLSWYGVTTTDEKPQSWWAKLARKILSRRQPKESGGNIFENLLKSEEEYYHLEALFVCIGSAVDVVPESAFLSVVKPALQKEAIDRFLYKQILAKFLGVSAIAVPLLVNVAIAQQKGKYKSWKEFKKSAFSAETATVMTSVAAPLVLTYAANKIDKETISDKMRGAILEDITNQRAVPESILKTLVGNKGLWAQLFGIVFLPIFVRSLTQ